jgi:integrase
MRLYQRRKRNGTKVWWATWTEGGVTQKRSTRAVTRAAAELVVARWDRERADPVYAASQSASFGIEAARFLKACEGAVERGKMAHGTLSMYRQKAGTLTRILGADLRLASIDGSTFADYLERRRAEFLEGRGRAITEANLYKEWVTFRQILKQAWRAQRFGRDPASLKPAHFGPEYKPRETALTWEQITLLTGQLSPARRAAVAFVLGCGARRREVFAARPGDIDLKAWRVLIRGTKTAAALRTIPIPKPMQPFVAFAAEHLPFPEWTNARRDLEIACAAAGIPRVTWNDLRRTFASLLVQAGVAPHIVAKLLGHTTTAMVDRVYGRQTAESLAGLIEAQLATTPTVSQKKRTSAARRKTKRT